jgi:NAD(P)-dependent dehydrogenase (short-subunit alcohol dehydrogenase family)
MSKTVLITGASSGIGRACALRLVREGFVVFAGVRNPKDAHDLQVEGGERMLPVEIDVTDADTIRDAVVLIRARVADRGLDGLVNNAGIGLSMPVEYMPLDKLRHQFEVNVFGQIAVTQAFLPLIREAVGRIVNIGSVGSHITIPFGGALCGSKYAFLALNDALRLELHPFGIHVSIIEPGAINTPAVAKTLGDVEGVIRAFPPEGAERYGEMLRTFTRRAYDRESHGSDPAVVATAVHHALTATHPRARYPVGKDARLMVTLPRILPDGLLDRIRWRLFGMPATLRKPSPPQTPRRA